MKPYYKYLLLIIAAITFVATGCKKEKASSFSITSGDYLLAGRTGGYVAAGSKATFYVLNNGEMRKDTNQREGAIPATISGFNFNTLLSTASYSEAAYLQTAVPAELLNRNGEHIGNYFPDMGYTLVMTRKDGVTYTWYFEGDQAGSSVAVQAFVQGIADHMLSK